MIEWSLQTPSPSPNDDRIYSLAELHGKIYGVTGDTYGMLLEWTEGDSIWRVVAPKSGTQAILWSVCAYNDKIYAGTSGNGLLLEWNGVNAWVQKAAQLVETAIISLAVYNGKLYGGTYPNAKLLEWNGTNAWTLVAGQPAAETYIRSLCVYKDKLYGVSYLNARLYEWNGVNAWVQVAAKFGSDTQAKSLVVYDGELYAGTGPTYGYLLKWNGVGSWLKVAEWYDGDTIQSLVVLGGKLYGLVASAGKTDFTGYYLLMYDKSLSDWTEVSKLSLVGANGMQVLNNKLYIGTSDAFASLGGDPGCQLLLGEPVSIKEKRDDVRQSTAVVACDGTRLRSLRHKTLSPLVIG